MVPEDDWQQPVRTSLQGQLGILYTMYTLFHYLLPFVISGYAELPMFRPPCPSAISEQAELPFYEVPKLFTKIGCM
jgi:hypothetical protein